MKRRAVETHTLLCYVVRTLTIILYGGGLAMLFSLLFCHCWHDEVKKTLLSFYRPYFMSEYLTARVILVVLTQWRNKVEGD